MKGKGGFISKRKLLISVLSLFMIVACRLLPQSSYTAVPSNTQTSSITQNQISEKTSTHTFAPPTKLPTSPLIDYILSGNAGEYVGNVVTIRIEKAYCSYRPDVNGAPTFCNDQPFPNHSFTMVAWGKDWTDLDGKCLYIEGEVEEYEGKYEIIADSRDQVTLCE